MKNLLVIFCLATAPLLGSEPLNACGPSAFNFEGVVEIHRSFEGVVNAVPELKSTAPQILIDIVTSYSQGERTLEDCVQGLETPLKQARMITAILIWRQEQIPAIPELSTLKESIAEAIDLIATPRFWRMMGKAPCQVWKIRDLDQFQPSPQSKMLVWEAILSNMGHYENIFKKVRNANEMFWLMKKTELSLHLYVHKYIADKTK